MNYCSSLQQKQSADGQKRRDIMDIKLFDSELKVMGVLWKRGDTTAKKISDILKEEVGWNMNTTYTLIKRCI